MTHIPSLDPLQYPFQTKSDIAPENLHSSLPLSPSILSNPPSISLHIHQNTRLKTNTFQNPRPRTIPPRKFIFPRPSKHQILPIPYSREQRTFCRDSRCQYYWCIGDNLK